jgi:hypothetical protein
MEGFEMSSRRVCGAIISAVTFVFVYLKQPPPDVSSNNTQDTSVEEKYSFPVLKKAHVAMIPASNQKTEINQHAANSSASNKGTEEIDEVLPTDYQKVERILDLMTEDGSEFEKYAEIFSITCRTYFCKIRARPKEDPALLQSVMVKQLEESPWIGTHLRIELIDDHTNAVEFTFIGE